MPCQALAGLQAAGQVEGVGIVAAGLGRNRSDIDLLHRECLLELCASGAAPRGITPISIIVWLEHLPVDAVDAQLSM
jgi:hypothetical protein